MFGFLFGKNNASRSRTNLPKRRRLTLESLENRELLSVAPTSVPKPDYLDADWFEQITQENRVTEPTESGFVSNEWLVQIKDSFLPTLSSVSTAADYLQDFGVSVLRGLGSAGTLLVSMESDLDEAQSQILAGLECFDYWEQNYATVSSAVTDLFNDPMASLQWALDAVNVTSAWNTTRGSGVVVAVLDTGIQLNHPDLQANIWTNTAEIAGNGIDDDGNGFADDVHGWNSGLGNGNVNDTHSHGTHVSGIVAAVGNNGTGLVGVAPEAQILPVKMGDGSFTSDAVIAAINYVVKLKTTQNVNVRVMNGSFGGDHDGVIYRSAVQAAANADILFVVSAGNSSRNVDISPHAPSGLNDMENVISIASTDKENNLSVFSNYGVEKVDLAAPGTGILSTLISSQYGEKSGTSMAAPMVAGAAALVAAANPDWSAAEIKAALMNTATTLSSLTGKTKTGGLLNVGKAIVGVSGVPTAPSGLLSDVQEDGSIRLSWLDNSNNEVFFELQCSTDGGNNWTTIDDKIATSSKVYDYIPSQVANTLFRLRAVNSEGESGWSNTATVTRESLEISPQSPLMKFGTGLDAAQGFNLVWQDRSLNETSFEVQRSIDGGATWTTVKTLGANTTSTYVPVVEGVANHFRVRAGNEFGNSGWSQTTTWDATALPLAPTNLRVVMTNEASANLKWDYERANLIAVCVEYSRDGGKTWTANVYRYDVWDGWIGGHGFAYFGPVETWLFRVRNWNTNGYSDYSNTISVRYAGIPYLAAPTNLTLVSDSIQSFHLYWNDNAATESSYEMQYSKDGGATWEVYKYLDANTATTTFHNGTSTADYRFRVRAVGSTGVSAWSNVVSGKVLSSGHLYWPYDLSVTSQPGEKFLLEWTDGSTNENDFEIQHSFDGGKSWWTTAVVAPNTTSLSISVNPDFDYTFRVRARNDRTTSLWSESVTNRWIEPGELPAPSNLVAVPANANDIKLTWDAVSGATAYRIEYSYSPDRNWTKAYEGANTTFTHTRTTEGVTLYYRVIALKNAAQSVASEVVSVKTGALSLPTPTNVTAAQANQKDAKISWSAVSGATSYRVVRSLTGTGNWQQVYSGSQTSFTDTSTVENTTYYYRVYAKSSTKESAASATVSVKTGEVPLAAPVRLDAALKGFTDVEVGWSAVAKATSYRLERSSNDGATWTTVYMGDARYYLDQATEESTAYQYRVFALNSLSVSPASSIVSVETGFDPAVEPPATPTGFKLSYVGYDWNEFGVEWNAVEGAASYRVERSLAGAGDWLEVYSGSNTWFYDKNLEWNTTYDYRIVAVNKLGESAYSAVQSKKTVLEPGPLRATAQMDCNVSLGWKKSTGNVSYLIERSTDGVTWKKLKTVKNVDSYYDTSTAALTTYQYRVTEITPYSTTVWTREVTTVAASVKPPTLKLATGNSVNITWAVTKGNTGYEVQRSTDGWNWEIVPGVQTTAKTKVTLIDYGLDANTTYYYQIKAKGYDELTDAIITSYKTITTGPEVPQDVVVSNVTHNSATLSWAAVEGATGYKIEYLKNGKWVSGGTSKTTTKVVKSLKAGTEYTFRVIATNKAGTSATDAQIRLTTVVKAPAAPTLKTLDSNSISVTWKEVKEATGYIVERSTDGIVWETVDVEPTVNKTKFTLVDADLEANTSYYYRITAKGVDESTNSAPAATKKAVTTAPATPENIVVKKTDYNLVVLAWDAVAGATSYKVEKFVNGKWTSAGSSKTTEITIKSLKPSTDYSYRIVAVGKAGKSTPCTPLTITTPIAPPATPKLKATPRDAATIQLSWNTVSGAEKYILERYDAWNGTWITLTETTETVFTDTSLTANFSYGYRVTAVNSTGMSKPTSKVTGKTPKA